MSPSKLLPLLSLLSLLIAGGACDIGTENAQPAGIDGCCAYPNDGWVDVDPMNITKACPPQTVKANEAYALRVKYQAPCWGVELTAGCTATLKGKTIELDITYQQPNWVSDSCYCEKEITCLLPALPAGDYVLGPGSSCSPAAVTLKVGAQHSGAATCSPTSC
jgi:hypothetical protein